MSWRNVLFSLYRKKEERPGATELLINEFPAEYVSDAHYSTYDLDWTPFKNNLLYFS